MAWGVVAGDWWRGCSRRVREAGSKGPLLGPGLGIAEGEGWEAENSTSAPGLFTGKVTILEAVAVVTQKFLRKIH